MGWSRRYFPRGGYNGPMHHDRHAEGGRGANESSDGTQPTMMSFKTFLGTQDDTISDEEAVKKYAEYKMEFKRQQLNEFFVSHKDEECTSAKLTEGTSSDTTSNASCSGTRTSKTSSNLN